MLEYKNKLEQIGHSVQVPLDTNECLENPSLNANVEYALESDIQGRCFKEISKADAILVLNFDKNGIKNYVGGATLMEMGLAQHLGKKIFMLNPPPKFEDLRYHIEICATRPVILNGELNKIEES